MNQPFTIHVTNKGEITFPAGCKDIWETQRQVEVRLNARYEANNQQEIDHQFKPVPSRTEEYHAKEVDRRKKQLENLCLVKAYETLPNWPERIEYLKELGYEHIGSPKMLRNKLGKIIADLIADGEYERLLAILNRQGEKKDAV